MEDKQHSPKTIAQEKKLEPALTSWIKKMKGLCIKWLPFQFTGLPDRICLLPGGRIFFVEVKTTGRNLRPRQRVVIRDLRALGFKVYVLDSYDVLNEIIRDYEI